MRENTCDQVTIGFGLLFFGWESGASLSYQSPCEVKQNQRKREIAFSNSLIIHQEKTKKITTVIVVWICVPNYHKILPTLALNFSKNYWSFEKPYQTLANRVCFIRYPNTSKSFKQNRLRFLFSQCLDIWWNTLSRVWYITSTLKWEPL